MKFASTKHASYFPLSPCEENRVKVRKTDFYKVYENDELLLRLAMKIGWTLNVVIMEAELTVETRKWYLEQALCRGWSKTQLLNAIRSGIDSTEH